MKQLFLILLLAFGFVASSCSLFTLEDPTQETDLANIISLRVESDDSVFEADGQTKVILVATLGEEADQGQNITFKTTNGKLSDLTSTQSPDTETVIEIKAGTRTAQALLTTGTEPSPRVIVSASVGDIETYKTLEFSPALPESATLEPDAFQLAVGSGANTTLKLVCYRSVGMPSDGIQAILSTMPKDTSTTALARFDEILLLNNGEASTEVSSVGQGTGTLIFTAAIPSANGDTIRKSAEILFQ